MKICWTLLNAFPILSKCSYSFTHFVNMIMLIDFRVLKSILHFWDKSHEVVIYYHFNILFIVNSEVAQSCPTLCDPMDCSLPGSSVHGIFQAIVLEWIAISFSRRSSQPRDRTRVSRIVDRCFTVWATREVKNKQSCVPIKLYKKKKKNLSVGLIWQAEGRELYFAPRVDEPDQVK